MQWKEVLAGIALLVGGKLAVMAAIGPMFGLTQLSAIRAGLLIAPGRYGGDHKSIRHPGIYRLEYYIRTSDHEYELVMIQYYPMHQNIQGFFPKGCTNE